MSKNIRKPSDKNNPALIAPPPVKTANRTERSQPAMREKSTFIPDVLRTNLAIGILTLAITILLLYIENNIVYNVYHPDIKAVLDKVLPLTILGPENFAPEPVERLQYQLTLLTMPVIILVIFSFIYKKKDFFSTKPTLSLIINVLGLFSFIVYLANLMHTNLLFIPDETNTKFFTYSFINKVNWLLAIAMYLALTFGFIVFIRQVTSKMWQTITSVVCYAVLALLLADMVMYNVFKLAGLEWGRVMETNAVFYSITQVFAGKSLLVNINSQYGLYAWMLNPIFKVIGLSVYKFSLVMGVLNAISFLLFYLGLKKVIKNDVMTLLTFLCFIFWFYWSGRMAPDPTVIYYYQYVPIRILFPALAFFLITRFHYGSDTLKKRLLSSLALVGGFAPLWNSDTGVVVWGAILLSLVFSAFDSDNLKNSIKKSAIYAIYMIGGLVVAVCFFVISTKVHSGSFPDYVSFSNFQKVFYISGFFMLPMGVIQFWNLPAMAYIVAGVYCAFYFRKVKSAEANTMMFLFILGAGLFVYFQGRSYDTNITAVMYPAIFITGILSWKLLQKLNETNIDFANRKIKLHEGMLIFLIPFLFIVDGASSMACHLPWAHSFSVKNATLTDDKKEQELKVRLDFIKNNIPENDSVIIISCNYESYYYTLGHYYNPVNIPGSTELFFKSEIYALLDKIKTTKCPIIYEPIHPWINNDTIAATLAQYTTVKKALPDQTMMLLEPGRKQTPQRLTIDANTMYYNASGEFNKFIYPKTKLTLPANYTIEFIATLDSAKLAPNSIIFSTVNQKVPNTGLIMTQFGNDLTQFVFSYGNGSTYANGVTCKLSTQTENHVVIKVAGTNITMYNNDALCGQINTNMAYRSSEGPFVVNGNFAGVIKELKVEVDR